MTTTHASLVRLALLAAAFFALSGCSSEPPLGGTFVGMATTPLPSPPLPAGDLMIDATLALDAEAGTFALDMDLGALGLTDTMDVRGTYVTAGGVLTLTPERFAIDPASMNTMTERTSTAPACITLAGFVDTIVCLPEQSPTYGVEGDELTFTLSHQIAGVDGSTPMVLTRVP